MAQMKFIVYNIVSNANRSKLISIMKRIAFVIVCLLFKIQLIAQTQYDYYDDGAVAGGADRALNGIIIIGGIVIIAVALFLLLFGVAKTYYWFNPEADPENKRKKNAQEKEKKHEEFVQKQRQKATPIAVDLGLSVKWASFNLGAYCPSDVGDLFYWGDNKPSERGFPKFRKVNVNTIGDISGNSDYDAATKQYGETWRIPTVSECKELIELCTWEAKTMDGVEGRQITGPNGDSIFLPYNENHTTGKFDHAHYWTSCPSFRVGLKESAQDLRFGKDCKQPAEIWCASVDYAMFPIRPVFSTITRKIREEQKQVDTRNAFVQINDSTKIEKSTVYKFYEEQCVVKEEEKESQISRLDGRYIFNKTTTITDSHGVVYSQDGKRLLDGTGCNCETYKILEGTEFICFDAFSVGITGRLFNDKRISIEKLILPSSLVYFPAIAVPDNCSMESYTPNYSVINDLLIDTRKRSVIKCLNKLVQKIEIYEPIEEIDEYAFVNCSLLREVVLPKSIKRIGVGAFSHCEILNSINLPDSISIISEKAFNNCKSLLINSLPKSLSIIEDSAFQWCIIEGITIPKNIKEIGKSPFSKNIKNTKSDSSKFIIENSLLIDSDSNEIIQLVNSETKSVSIPTSITKIRSNAFIHTDIETIIIPSSIKEIGIGLFWNCEKLSEVQLKCRIERIPNSMFGGCLSLLSISLPESIRIIELGAFYGCENLVNIKLNQGLRVIEKRAFEKCCNLSSLRFPETIECVGEENGYCFTDCEKLQEVYYDASDAVSVKMPRCVRNLTIGEHVNSLPEGFISFNKVLETLTIPENVHIIKKRCIHDCPNLKEVSIHSKEIRIEEGWIKNCSNLQIIRVHADAYDTLKPFLPIENKPKVRKIYNHKFLFFKW